MALTHRRERERKKTTMKKEEIVREIDSSKRHACILKDLVNMN